MPRLPSCMPSSGECHLYLSLQNKPYYCRLRKDIVIISCTFFVSFLRTTVLAAVAFLDAFQKVADMATNTRGRTVCMCVWSGVCM